jgi:hypothetical protein
MDFSEQYATAAAFAGAGIIITVLGFIVAAVAVLSPLDGRAYKIVRGLGIAMFAVGLIGGLSSAIQQSVLVNAHVNEVVRAQHGGEVKSVNWVKNSDGNTYTATYIRNGVETPSIVHLDGNKVTIKSTTGESF